MHAREHLEGSHSWRKTKNPRTFIRCEDFNMNGSAVIEIVANTPVKTIDTSTLSSDTYIVSANTYNKHFGSSRLIIK